LHIGQPPSQSLILGPGPHRGDDRKSAIGMPGDHIHQHIQRALIGPLKIIDDEHHRPIPGRPVQPRVEPLERDILPQAGPP
jgi:hypothetical protein